MSANVHEPVKITPRAKFLLIVGLFSFISAAQLYAVQLSTALPKIVDAIGGMEYLALVFTAIMMGSAIVSPIAGKLSDLAGRRRVLVVGALVLFASEILGLFVQNMFQLIALSLVQGIGGGFSITVSLIVIADVCTKEERAKYIGYYGSLMAALMIIGPLLGGIIVDNLNWHFIFVTLMVFCLTGFLLMFKFMPEIPKSPNAKIDYAGSLLMTVFIVLVVAVSVLGGKTYPWSSSTILIMIAGAILSLILFIVVENRVSNPIISMSIFTNFTFVLCFVACFLVIMVGVAISYYFPVYAQKVKGLTPTMSGMFISGKGIVAFFISAFNGWLISRLRDYRWNALVTILLLIVSVYGFYLMDVNTSLTFIIAVVVIWGLSPYNNIFHIGAQMSLPNTMIVYAMSAMQLAVSLGATLGNVLWGVLLRNPDLAMGIKNIFLTSIVLSVLVFVCVLALFFGKRNAQG
ncbi:MFS transporter [Phosphitispora sp. TUW77]|uniref:MFS transporter n=1 Tax=Phosphitispora sp. TUW77 TaxID=3152361 RepID=UPI003AB4F027